MTNIDLLQQIRENFNLSHCPEESLKLFDLSNTVDEALKAIKEMEKVEKLYCEIYPHNGPVHFGILKIAKSTLGKMYSQARISYLVEFQKYLCDLELEQEIQNAQ